MQPTTRPRIELDMQGLRMQADSFRAGGPRIRRTALSVRHVELRDCAPRPEGGPGWRKIACYHATANVPRDAHACLLQVNCLAPACVPCLLHMLCLIPHSRHC